MTIRTLREYWPDMLLWLLAAAAFFLRMGYMPLSADEPIRAIIAYNMALSGDFVVPQLNGEVYLNKPPLYNWILLGFFVLTGSFEEWVVRLPAILSILVFGIYLYRFTRSETENKALAFLVAMAFMTTGNLLFYSSYLGHIDVTYSLVTFAIFVVVYRGVKYEEWVSMFLLSYVLCWIGFMMKGLPSLLFVALTIAPWLIYKGYWKKLFSIEHFTGIATFITLLAVYFTLYKQRADLMPFLEQLWSESAKRTVTDKNLIQSFTHLYEFPLKFLLDIAPWGILILLLPFRQFRKKMFAHDLTRFAGMVFIFNIIIYWLSPDYRARYVFMLMPLFLLVVLYPLTVSDYFRSLSRIVGLLAMLGLTIIMVFGIYLAIEKNNMGMALTAGIAGLWLMTSLVYMHQHNFGWKNLVALLFICRIAYSYTVIPERVEESAYLKEKEQAAEIARITEGSDLAMYHSNVNNTMNWYISTARMEPLETKLDGDRFYFDEYYLVPEDVLTDSTNYTSYYYFVRRYLEKPFKLVKFHDYFPPMPKAKPDAEDLTGNSRNE